MHGLELFAGFIGPSPIEVFLLSYFCVLGVDVYRLRNGGSPTNLQTLIAAILMTLILCTAIRLL